MQKVIVTNEEELKRLISETIKEALTQMGGRFEPGRPAYEEPLLTRNEIAAYLNISVVTLTKWVRRGLPHIRKGGRVLFLRSEVLEAIKDRPVAARGKKK